MKTSVVALACILAVAGSFLVPGSAIIGMGAMVLGAALLTFTGWGNPERRVDTLFAFAGIFSAFAWISGLYGDPTVQAVVQGAGFSVFWTIVASIAISTRKLKKNIGFIAAFFSDIPCVIAAGLTAFGIHHPEYLWASMGGAATSLVTGYLVTHWEALNGPVAAKAEPERKLNVRQVEAIVVALSDDSQPAPSLDELLAKLKKTSAGWRTAVQRVIDAAPATLLPSESQDVSQLKLRHRDFGLAKTARRIHVDETAENMKAIALVKAAKPETKVVKAKEPAPAQKPVEPPMQARVERAPIPAPVPQPLPVAVQAPQPPVAVPPVPVATSASQPKPSQAKEAKPVRLLSKGQIQSIAVAKALARDMRTSEPSAKALAETTLMIVNPSTQLQKAIDDVPAAPVEQYRISGEKRSLLKKAALLDRKTETPRTAEQLVKEFGMPESNPCYEAVRAYTTKVVDDAATAENEADQSLSLFEKAEIRKVQAKYENATMEAILTALGLNVSPLLVQTAKDAMGEPVSFLEWIVSWFIWPQVAETPELLGKKEEMSKDDSGPLRTPAPVVATGADENPAPEEQADAA